MSTADLAVSPLFDTERLIVFVTVMEHGSFSAAARRLGRVPSAVSMSIGHLEAELGLSLFDRGRREPVPTAQAQALLPQARRLLDQLRQLDSHARALSSGLESALTLAVVPELLAATPWTHALAALARTHPLLPVEVLAAPQADALAMVRAGRAQLALVFERLGVDTGEAFQELGQETLVAVVAPQHPMLHPGLVNDADLLEHRQILVAGRHSTEVDQRIALSRQLWRTDTPQAALQMVLAGLGWAWLPRGFVRAPLAAGTLAEIPSRQFTNLLRLWVDVVWSRHHPPGPATRELLRLLETAFEAEDRGSPPSRG
ncbi:MAG: LysR family transcriptional regulator [Sphaerotilus natans subsp. sulfidivorans]|uniref:LysR family transcriptional regulator n=1 Tax=Sphaerotilus sulfidivorans TaxID=639200 RepID=UPI002355C0B2|nr:LysR family transcriptional regulator [Sphaerotilus sulfidivorans]MCK6403781.1 LysR family transcriptional regulator [Sphaerotilus sulfidivorans]